jgi:hypothetical protein
MSLPPDCNPGQEYRMGGAAPKEIPAEGTLVRASRSARTRSRPFGARPLATMAAFFIWRAGGLVAGAFLAALPVHLEILSASRSQTFTCCHRLPAYLNSSSRGFSRPK